MPLKRLLFRPGISRENTRYASEVLGAGNAPGATAGWYAMDKVRFRSGTPEKLGGWVRISQWTYQGVCRALHNWITLGGSNLLSVGTHLKYYVESGGQYYDITPLRSSVTLNGPFAATDGLSVIEVTDVAHGCEDGDFVTFSGAASLGGNITAGVLNAEFQVTVVDADTYTIDTGVLANASDVGDGGATVGAAYQINVGADIQSPTEGWGTGGWGLGGWGVGLPGTQNLRLWSQSNFGEDLIFGPRDGAIYYWDASSGTGTRGVLLSSLPGASDVPEVQSFLMVSDASRFVIAFGASDLGSSTQDPLLIRWSDQEDATNWTPAATNQAGDIRLSQGSMIVTAVQSRQEIVVFTDSALYSMQYVGPPEVWPVQPLASNISIIGQNAAATASGVVFWMGTDKFYKYDGRVLTMRCDVRQYVFSDINLDQRQQVFCGTNEGFSEVWWFYCSANSTTVDRYVIYNYGEDIWYYGTMARTAWLDSGLRGSPLAATYESNLVEHETGVDDGTLEMPAAIDAYIESAEFDVDDGHNFGFVYRLLPDITFRGSTSTNGTPRATFQLKPLRNSGSGYNNPESVAGSSSAVVSRIATVPVEEFTGQVYIRVRGRQMVLRVSSDTLGTTWQLGTPRIDIRLDGRA